MQSKWRRYRGKVRRIEAKRLDFVEETGVKTAMSQTHSYARRVERSERSVLFACSSTILISALGLDGVREVIFSGEDTQAFKTYVYQVLVSEFRLGEWRCSIT